MCGRRAVSGQRYNETMFAQSFADYGTVGLMAAKAERMVYSARYWAESLSPTQWGVIAVVVLGLLVWKVR